jgi:hypothetical protein
VERGIACLAVVAVVGSFAPALATAAAKTTPPRQTKQRAERNLLGATRMLARWHVGLVDPRTGLLRSNTIATCAGRGTAVRHAYREFNCVLRYRKTSVRLRYVVQSRNGFEVRRL